MSTSQFSRPSRFAPNAGVEVQFDAACAGDRRAQDKILRALAPDILATARRLLGPEFAALAEDVTQDSLIAVAKGLARVHDHRRLRAYAIKITVRTAVRARRKARRFVYSEPQPTTSGDVVEFEAHRRRQIDALLGLLDELPEAQARALFLQVALDQSLDDVARTLDVPANTVRSRVRLGRAAIQRKLSKRPSLRALLEARHDG